MSAGRSSSGTSRTFRARASRRCRDGALEQALAQLRTRPADEDLVVLVLHVVDALAERRRRPAARTVPGAGCPYFASMACQPAAANMPSTRRMRMPGTTRSRLWRLRSTIIVTLPSSPRPSSRIASQTLPSSSSASPTSATNRRSGWLAIDLAEVEPQVAVGQRREHRRDRAKPDRARREVDAVGVLGPRRVRLEPAELAQPGQHRRRRGCRAGTGASGRPARRAA